MQVSIREDNKEYFTIDNNLLRYDDNENYSGWQNFYPHCDDDKVTHMPESNKEIKKCLEVVLQRYSI